MDADCNFRTNYFLMLYNGYVFYILEMSDKFCKKITCLSFFLSDSEISYFGFWYTF